MKWSMIATWRMALEGVRSGTRILREHGNIHQAVVNAVTEVEDDENFQSVGYGGLPNRNGEVELDAAYMNGDTLDAGGIMAVQNIKNPIQVAYTLSKYKRNCFLAGTGAMKFAQEHHFIMQDMLAPSARKRYEEMKVNLEEMVQQEAYQGHDTVCVIGRDDNGSMACGVSTSGLFLKQPGRVGDSPIIGSGFYVDSEIGGAAATGVGEDIMKGCLAFSIVEKLKLGTEVQRACEEVLNHHEENMMKRNGSVGSMSVIAMDKNGHVGAATNLDIFPFSVGDADGNCQVLAAIHENGKIKILES